MALDLDSITSNAVIVRDHMFMFATDDPQIFLPAKPEHLLQANEVVMSCTYTHFGDEALREIIGKLESDQGKGQRCIPFRWFR